MKHSGTEQRDRAARRISKQHASLRIARTLTGEEVYKECMDQGLEPRFRGAVFDRWVDRHTRKDAVTTLPPLVGEVREAFLKAYHEDIQKGAEEMEAEALKKAEKGPEAETAAQTGESAENPFKARSRVKPGQKIHLLAQANPRKPGTKVWTSFNLYKEGMTVEEYLKLEGAGKNHLLWDIDCKFIELKD
jgi:hypothetical protein